MYSDNFLVAAFALVLSIIGFAREPTPEATVRTFPHQIEVGPVEFRCICEATPEKADNRKYFVLVLLFFVGVFVGSLATWCCTRRLRRRSACPSQGTVTGAKGQGRLLNVGLNGN